MTVGERLREERARLSMTQPQFAELASVRKGTQISWEKDASSPTAHALVAFAEAGADVLYILTGKRTVDIPINAARMVEAQLADTTRDLIEPERQALPGESMEQTERRVFEWHANSIGSILKHDAQLIPPETLEQATNLLEILVNPDAIASYRAADHAQRRAKRQEMRDRISDWFQGGPYVPGDAVASLLADLAMEQSVPIKRLVELVEEVHRDVTRRADTMRGMEPSR